MKLVWTRRAATDRQAIRAYIARDDVRAAIALDELLKLKAQALVAHPGLGRLGRVAGTRQLVAHKHYLLIYDTGEDHVRILRVLHTARRWPLRTDAGEDE